MRQGGVATALLLATGILATSQSGNIIRLGAASPIAITMWRLTLASLFILPFALKSRFRLHVLSHREKGLIVLCGVLLALHFYSWIYAVQKTTVANACIIFSLNPLFTALADRFMFKEKLSGKFISALTCGIIGVGIVAWEGVSLGREHALGVLSSLVCALFFTAYFLIGKTLRRKMPTSVYVTAIYGIAAVISLALLLCTGTPLIHYTPQTWLCFSLMALVPTIIGHTTLNYALGRYTASWVSTLTLAEPLLAAIGASLFWREPFTPSTIGGFFLISLSTMILATDEAKTGSTRRVAGAVEQAV